MKSYASDAVTKDNLSELDERQSREIEKLHLYIVILALSQFATFAMTAGLFLMN